MLQELRLRLSHIMRIGRRGRGRKDIEPNPHHSLAELGQEFERLYRAHPDPWEYQVTSYEQERLKRLVDLCPTEQTRAILEIGCGEGELTKRLKAKNPNVKIFGVDCSPTAISRARKIVPNVTFALNTFGLEPLPKYFPRRFDLIIAADVLYYGTPIERQRMIKLLPNLLTAHGRLIVSLCPRYDQKEIDQLKRNWIVENDCQISNLTWIARLRPSS